VTTPTKVVPINYATDQLRGAADTIKDVAALLDRTGDPCPHCGRYHFNNWAHHQVGKQLDALVLKLGKLADELAREATSLDAPQGGNNA
jgi:hypothetical protein